MEAETKLKLLPPTKFEMSDPLKFGFLFARLLYIHGRDCCTNVGKCIGGISTRRMTFDMGDSIEVSRRVRENYWDININGVNHRADNWDSLIKYIDKFVKIGR